MLVSVFVDKLGLQYLYNIPKSVFLVSEVLTKQPHKNFRRMDCC